MDDPNVGSEEHMKAMWAGQSNVLVAVRVRPLMKHDIIKRSCVKVLDSKLIIILDPAFGDKQDILRANRSREKQYAFDYAFDPNASQMQVYNHTTKFLIRGVLDGYNATVFAYGQTGSGKTHTMIGSPNDPGIMVRVMEDLTSYRKIIVHFRNEKDVQEFAKLINQKITHKQPTLWYPYMPNSVCSHLIYSQSNKNEEIENNE